MKIFDNITDIVRDDLKKTIKHGSKVSIAAACFSMYAYKKLKSQLEQVGEFRFICIYTPSNYIFPSKIAKYIDLTQDAIHQYGIRQSMNSAGRCHSFS